MGTGDCPPRRVERLLVSMAGDHGDLRRLDRLFRGGETVFGLADLRCEAVGLAVELGLASADLGDAGVMAPVGKRRGLGSGERLHRQDLRCEWAGWTVASAGRAGHGC